MSFDALREARSRIEDALETQGRTLSEAGTETLAELIAWGGGMSSSEFFTALERAIEADQPEEDPPVGRAPDQTPGISAEVHSDDRQATAEFDAEDWFIIASDAQIEALARTGWGSDYAADAVARHFEDTDSEVAAVFAYADEVGSGFDCTVDKSEALAWLERRRPSLWEALTGTSAPA